MTDGGCRIDWTQGFPQNESFRLKNKPKICLINDFLFGRHNFSAEDTASQVSFAPLGLGFGLNSYLWLTQRALFFHRYAAQFCARCNA
jgi:hypothetical protein